jgi:hypothetical protein
VRIYCLVLLSAVAGPALYGQVFEVNGGTSSLYQAQGGTVSAHGGSYDASIGAGIVEGKFVGGANLSDQRGKATYIFGNDTIPFVLPTDIFDTSHYLVALGGGVKTSLFDTDIFAFAGATSETFASPFVEGMRAENPAGIVFLKKQLSSHVQTTTNLVFSRQTTAIQGLEWVPEKTLKLAASAGVGADQPYGAASVDFSRPRIDVKAAYIEAGDRFQRVAVEAPLLSEPDRENVSITVRPASFLTFSGGRQNFLTPLSAAGTSVRSDADNVSGALRALGTGLSATYYHSSYQGNWNDATAYTVDRSFFSRFRTVSSYLESRPNNAPVSRSFVTNISEVLTPRLNVTELVSHSHGQTTVSFGGGLLSNLVSITAEYQTYYIPERNSSPFEQALIVDATLHVFRGISLHGATFVAPDGSLRYTADTHAIAAREGSGAGSGPGIDRELLQASIGDMVLRGRVVDARGQPISGAALMIDGLLLYTDDDGIYVMRERKPHTHQLRIMANQFLSGDAYRVVSAPQTVRSAPDGNEPDTVIVVERAQEPGR